MEPQFKPAATTDCPACGVVGGQPCLDPQGNERQRFHVGRERVPALYRCKICGVPYSISQFTGARVHVGKIDANHSAQPYEEPQQWN